MTNTAAKRMTVSNSPIDKRTKFTGIFPFRPFHLKYNKNNRKSRTRSSENENAELGTAHWLHISQWWRAFHVVLNKPISCVPVTIIIRSNKDDSSCYTRLDVLSILCVLTERLVVNVVWKPWKWNKNMIKYVHRHFHALISPAWFQCYFKRTFEILQRKWKCCTVVLLALVAHLGNPSRPQKFIVKITGSLNRPSNTRHIDAVQQFFFVWGKKKEEN